MIWRNTLAAAAVLIGLTLISALTFADTHSTKGKDVHLGVASCSGSTCHGSVEPWSKSSVLQNEYIIWQRDDPHSKAYEVLLNEQSQRIARNLGLKSAHTAEVCLNCHSDNVAVANRGPMFQLEDGVGCESCHGGAVDWIGPHLSGNDHATNVANGMYPTEDPGKRASKCLSCHMGDQNRFVSHRIMGAGHPRMPFELDTFTALQPAHYVVDKDYAARKPVSNGARVWAIGQAASAMRLLELMSDEKKAMDGAFPELVFYDCHACHHPLTQQRWRPQESSNLGPGVIRINDVHLRMLRVVAAQVSVEKEKLLFSQTLALHRASTEGVSAIVAAARALQSTVARLEKEIAGRQFTRADMRSLLVRLVDDGVAGKFSDYAAAEQVNLALGSVVEAMRVNGSITGEQLKNIKAALDACYTATGNDASYDPVQHIEALKQVESHISTLRAGG